MWEVISEAKRMTFSQPVRESGNCQVTEEGKKRFTQAVYSGDGELLTSAGDVDGWWERKAVRGPSESH